MQYTIRISFDQNCDTPMGVYQVRLASENPSADSFGVKDITNSSVIVPFGTTVSENPDGTYSYVFTVENGHLYNVSWEVTGNAGESPSYKTYQVGPFYSVNNDNIRATTSHTGKFTQGGLATLLLKITNFNGMPVDAEDIYIEVYNEGSGDLVTLDNNIPEHVDTGFYVIDWNIPTDQEKGEYRVVWNYVADDIQKTEVQNMVISEKNTTTATLMYTGRELEFRLALEHHLNCAQSIPVYFEQARPSRDNKIFKFSFGNWNQSSGVQIYRNDNIVNCGIEVDYFKGKVIFDEELLPQEKVNADYNFRWFSDEELQRFLNNAVQLVNIYPPASNYNLGSVPNQFIPVILYSAAKDALRHIMMCLQFQQPQQVFGGEEGAQRAFSNMEALKKNYEGEVDKLLENKKYGRYPRIAMNVVPEYTLPGGRSRWFRMLFK